MAGLQTAVFGGVPPYCGISFSAPLTSLSQRRKIRTAAYPLSFQLPGLPDCFFVCPRSYRFRVSGTAALSGTSLRCRSSARQNHRGPGCRTNFQSVSYAEMRRSIFSSLPYASFSVLLGRSRCFQAERIVGDLLRRRLAQRVQKFNAETSVSPSPRRRRAPREVKCLRRRQSRR